jgi:hypothetical protein
MLINGPASEFFMPKRELRQGFPLFLLLFLYSIFILQRGTIIGSGDILV